MRKEYRNFSKEMGVLVLYILISGMVLGKLIRFFVLILVRI